MPANQSSHTGMFGIKLCFLAFIIKNNLVVLSPTHFPPAPLLQAKGHDTSQHVLACFGGAGGQHACAIARSLGMKTVFIHK